MILCQCARLESNLLSAVVCCYLLLSCICALFLCLLSVIWGVAFYCVAVNVLYCLCEHIYYLYDALMSAIMSGDSIVLIRLYYCISYYMILVVYYCL